jgi:hypothetical protein
MRLICFPYAQPKKLRAVMCATVGFIRDTLDVSEVTKDIPTDVGDDDAAVVVYSQENEVDLSEFGIVFFVMIDTAGLDDDHNRAFHHVLAQAGNKTRVLTVGSYNAGILEDKYRFARVSSAAELLATERSVLSTYRTVVHRRFPPAITRAVLLAQYGDPRGAFRGSLIPNVQLDILEAFEHAHIARAVRRYEVAVSIPRREDLKLPPVHRYGTLATACPFPLRVVIFGFEDIADAENALEVVREGDIALFCVGYPTRHSLGNAIMEVFRAGESKVIEF